MSGDLMDALRANPVAKLLTQIEQNTRSERTAVLYKTRQELGAHKVRVKLRANVYAITDIDNVKQEFTANFSVRARWKEPLMQGLSEKADIDWDDQWNPRIELDNSVTIKNFDRTYELRYFQSDKADKIPHVCLTMNVSATFKEMFELDEFPLDYQALNIWLISEWPFTQVELVKDDEYMDHLSVSTFTESKEWELYPQLIGEPVGEAEDVDEVRGSTSQYPLYTITAHVKRLHQFYMWNHVLYMFMLFMVGLCTFSIPYTEVGSRVTGAVLILLCALVYRLHMQPSLPVVAYWTALDKYNMAIMLCHILILMEHAIVGKVAGSDSQDAVKQAGQADYACLAAIVAIMLAVHCYFIAFFVQTLMKRNKFLGEETKNFEEVNDEILQKYDERVKSGRWKYEPPPSDPVKRRPMYSSFNGQSPSTPRYNPMVREDVMRHSQRGPQALLPPLPPSPRVPMSGTRQLVHQVHMDQINPVEATHEIKIPMPAEVVHARGRSRSRSLSRSRLGRNNRVASEQTDTSAEE